MTPWFVLSYPRSRTAWLATFLTGAGAPTIHEGWKYCRTAKELRMLLESFDADVTCNSDCANLFMLEEILQEFPEAKFIKIENDIERVLWSLQNSPYGRYSELDLAELLQGYAMAWAQAEGYRLRAERLDMAQWGPEDSAALYRAMTGRDAASWWVSMMHGLNVEIRDERVALDVQRAARGDLDHILSALKRIITWHS